MGVIKGVISNKPCLKVMKSNRLPIKLHLPNNLPFPNTKPFPTSSFCKLVSCSAILKHKSQSEDDKLLDEIAYDLLPKKSLTVTVLLVDVDGQLKLKLDDLVRKADNDKTAILREVMSFLLDNVHHSMSSRFIVSSNKKESYLKLLKSEQMIAHKLILCPDIPQPDMSNSVRCTEVFVDVYSIVGAIDDKFKVIRSREELKVLLRHMMSMERVMDPVVFCTPVLVSKDKTKPLEVFSHTTT